MANYYGSIITETVHPFGRGALTSTGAQYSATVSSGVVADVFATVETVTVPLPINAMLKEVEYGLTTGLSLTTSTAAVELRYKITDTGGSSYDAVLTSTSLLSVVSTGALTDVTYSGRQTPSSGTYFTGKGSFDVVCDIGCGSTSKSQGATKNSSYLTYKYYLVG